MRFQARLRKGILGVLFLLLALSVSAEDEPRRFFFRGDRSSTVLSSGGERTRLEGNARVETDGVIISADSIEVYGESFRYAEAEGNLRVSDADRGIELTAQSFFYDRELETSRAEGAVYLEDSRNKIVVRAGYMEQYGSEDIVLLQVNVRVFREDMTARAEVVRFLREQDMVELSGLPVVYWKGDEYRAARIQMDLERDEIVLEGGVQGTVRLDSEEDEQAAAETDAGEPGEQPLDGAAAGVPAEQTPVDAPGETSDSE